MPVVSPYINSSSTLSGSYRSTLTSTSSLDKPYFRSSSSGTYVSSTLRSSYGDRSTEYRNRYTDVDGKRERKSSLVEYSRNSRAPSVTDSDSGVSTRFRSDRSESRGRDVSTTRSESSKVERPKRSFPTSSALAMSTAELYNKYSPANYIPYTQRIQQQQNEIARSKSISNDIGRPPASDGSRLRKPRNSAATIIERPEGRRSYKESSPSSYGKRNSMINGNKDSNGNEVPSVSEIRKRFDSKMTVTKLPANDTRYTKTVDHYLNQLKDVENGTGYTKVVPKDEKPVPIHLPYADKNGFSKWETSSSRSNSNSDLSLSKTTSEPTSLAKPAAEKNGMSTSLTIKLPYDRIASIKSQLDPNNPIGKILEKSTVIHVENGDEDRLKRNSPEVTPKLKEIKNDIEKQVKAPHTSNFASYIQISQPIASGTTPKKEDDEPRKSKIGLKYIDSEEDKLVLDNDIESPSGTGFENKTFEHENFLKKRSENLDSEIEDGIKSMETSTESTVSEPTEDSSPDTPSARRKILDAKDIEDIKAFEEDLENYNKWIAGAKPRLKLNATLKNYLTTREENVGVLTQASTSSAAVKTIHTVNAGVQCRGIAMPNKSTMAKPQTKDKSTNFRARKIKVMPSQVSNLLDCEETHQSSPSSPSLFGSSNIDSGSSSAKNENDKCGRQQLLKKIYNKPKMYLGLPKNYWWIIEFVAQKSASVALYIIMTLFKLKNNDSFARMSDEFEMARSTIRLVFEKNVVALSTYMQNCIYLPPLLMIKKNLPLAFKIRYSNVQCIIDCFEIQIEKPTDPNAQAQTWSQYKSCNTMKYLIACTPAGYIAYVSQGYGGRTSDKAITEKCGFIDILPVNAVIMADRGFKEIEAALSTKNIKLLRPPSVFSNKTLTKEEVIKTKVIASLRVHVERVIRKVREFHMLKPHAVVNNKHTKYLNELVTIACGLINLQDPIIKDY